MSTVAIAVLEGVIVGHGNVVRVEIVPDEILAEGYQAAGTEASPSAGCV